MLGVAFHARGIFSCARTHTHARNAPTSSYVYGTRPRGGIRKNVNVSFDWGPGELVTTDRMFPYLLLNKTERDSVLFPVNIHALPVCLPR